MWPFPEEVANHFDRRDNCGSRWFRWDIYELAKPKLKVFWLIGNPLMFLSDVYVSRLDVSSNQDFWILRLCFYAASELITRIFSNSEKNLRTKHVFRLIFIQVDTPHRFSDVELEFRHT